VKAKTDKNVFVAKFIHRKSWVVTGNEDRFIRIYKIDTDTNPLPRIHKFKAHEDWVR